MEKQKNVLDLTGNEELQPVRALGQITLGQMNGGLQHYAINELNTYSFQ